VQQQGLILRYHMCYGSEQPVSEEGGGSERRATQPFFLYKIN